MAFGGHRVLQSVSFTLSKGQLSVIRGENGSGKTTLLNILSGHLRPESGQVTYLMDEREVSLSHQSPEHLAECGIGRTWQDIRLFPTMTVLENVLAGDSLERDSLFGGRTRDAASKNGTSAVSARWLGPVLGTGLVGAAGEALMLLKPFGAILGHSWTERLDSRREYSLELAKHNLELVGMQRRVNASCDKLSVGQMKRVALARALQKNPQVLLLDEPLASLDQESTASVVSLLRHLTQECERTVVVIEHRLEPLYDIADRTFLLQEGRMLEV